MFGLVQSLFGWVALILGIVLASHFYRRLSKSVFGRFFKPGVATVLSFIIIFVVVVVIMSILAVWLNKLVTASMFNWVNKFGGAVFGLLIGCVILDALLAIILKFFGNQTFITKSAIASFLIDKVSLLLKLLPGEFNVFHSFFH
jgi:membrane protein required for colicin V production